MNNDDPLVGLYINYNLDASFFINKSKKYWTDSLEPHTHAIHGIGVECIAWGGSFGEGKHMHWKRLKKVAFVDLPTLFMLISPMEESTFLKDLFLVKFSICTCSFMAKAKRTWVEKERIQFFLTRRSQMTLTKFGVWLVQVPIMSL